MPVSARVEQSGRDRDDPARPVSCAPAHHVRGVCIVPWSLKKRITTEEILIWAYRQQLVHLASPEGFDPSPAGGYSPGGGWAIEPVDSSLKQQMPAAHDAYRVHEAVQRLGREPMISPAWEPPAMAHGLAPRRPALKTSSRAELMMVSALRLPPDPVLHPEIEMRRTGTIYERDRRGNIRRNARGVSIEHLCMVEFSGDLPWIVAHSRFLYEQWAAGLRAVYDSLSARAALLAHELVNEFPPQKPWERLDTRPKLDIGSAR